MSTRMTLILCTAAALSLVCLTAAGYAQDAPAAPAPPEKHKPSPENPEKPADPPDALPVKPQDPPEKEPGHAPPASPDKPDEKAEDPPRPPDQPEGRPDSPDQPAEKPDEAKKPDKLENDPACAELRRMIIASTLVVAGRTSGFAQAYHAGKFTGQYEIEVRVDRVLKGVLGPVGRLTVRVTADDLEKNPALLAGLQDPGGPLFLVVLDEIDRFRMPPSFRLVYKTLSPQESEDRVLRIVTDEVARYATILKEGSMAERDTAQKVLARFGEPARDTLIEVQKTGDVDTAELARQALLAIHMNQVDPCRLAQTNTKYPCEPILIYESSELKEVIFRLSPGQIVFRFESFSSHGRGVTHIRARDGREGWIETAYCTEFQSE